MDDKTRARAEAWWTNLPDVDRAELLSLTRGSALPGRFVAPLAHVFGFAPIGAKWETQEGFAFHVDGPLAAFLDTRRPPACTHDVRTTTQREVDGGMTTRFITKCAICGEWLSAFDRPN